MLQARSIDDIALSHGQARWVVIHLNLRVGDDELMFDSYLKGLRSGGLPFSSEELGIGAGHNLTYRYEHLMELAVCLYLRTQAVPLNDISRLLVGQRSSLRSLLRQAYLERESGLGATRVVEIAGPVKVERRISGCHLSFMANHASSGILITAKARLLGPVEAFDHLMGEHDGFYPRPPVPVSELASRVVKLAAGVPVIRRGPR
jgi:hypothetical protein